MPGRHVPVPHVPRLGLQRLLLPERPDLCLGREQRPGVLSLRVGDAVEQLCPPPTSKRHHERAQSSLTLRNLLHYRAVCTGTAPNTISTGTPAATVTQSASFVPNAYFSFPYAQTTFANSPACFSAETACSDNYQVCLTDLQGGGGGAGLTIAVPGGGGVTVDGGRNIGASATSVCSSLSSIACSAVASANCDAYGPTSGAVSLRVARSGLVALILGALVLPVTAGLIP